MIDKDLTRQFEDQFHEVGEAHHQSYIETDGADPEWPLRYADFLRERLGDHLDANFTSSELQSFSYRVRVEESGCHGAQQQVFLQTFPEI